MYICCCRPTPPWLLGGVHFCLETGPYCGGQEEWVQWAATVQPRVGCTLYVHFTLFNTFISLPALQSSLTLALVWFKRYAGICLHSMLADAVLSLKNLIIPSLVKRSNVTMTFQMNLHARLVTLNFESHYVFLYYCDIDRFSNIYEDDPYCKLLFYNNPNMLLCCEFYF